MEEIGQQQQNRRLSRHHNHDHDHDQEHQVLEENTLILRKLVLTNGNHGPQRVRGGLCR